MPHEEVDSTIVYAPWSEVDYVILKSQKVDETLAVVTCDHQICHEPVLVEGKGTYKDLIYLYEDHLL